MSLASEDADDLGKNFVRCCWETAVACGASGVALWRMKKTKLSSWIVAVASVAQLVWANEPLIWLASPETVVEKPAFVAEVERLEGAPALGRFRVDFDMGATPPLAASLVQRRAIEEGGVSPANYAAALVALELKPDVGGIWSIESQNAYLPAASKWVTTSERSSTVGGLFNTRYLILWQNAFEQQGFPPGARVASSPAGLVLAKIPAEAPRVYLAVPHCVLNDAALYRLVHAPTFRAGHDAGLECDPRALASVNADLPLGRADLVRYEPEEVEVQVEARQSALLVLNDAFYSGWKAELDGKPAQLLLTNGAVRGLFVPPGSHRVRYVYSAPGFKVGAE